MFSTILLVVHNRILLCCFLFMFVCVSFFSLESQTDGKCHEDKQTSCTSECRVCDFMKKKNQTYMLTVRLKSFAEQFTIIELNIIVIFDYIKLLICTALKRNC